MKLKPEKEKITIINVLQDIFSKRDTSSAASVTVDVDGGITMENFRKIIDYTNHKAVIETKHKTVYIYGEDIVITHCDKHFATAQGDIRKIEIFSKR